MQIFLMMTRYNYTYAQMNGNTSFIARAAQIASEKGIIVVVAAGNEGNQTWKYIVTPADNEKVFYYWRRRQHREIL